MQFCPAQKIGFLCDRSPLIMADEDLVLDLQWTVKSHGRVWVPQQKQVNGISFVALTKWDRRCVLAMSGQALDLRKDKEGGSLNCQAWQELLQLRQSEADKAVQEALKHEETDEKKLKKVQRARSKHDFLAPPIMHVFFKDKHISILYEGIQSSTIWVEANQEAVMKSIWELGLDASDMIHKP
ncbi:unnamed protein product, partial [Symbiodinium necroappetens]